MWFTKKTEADPVTQAQTADSERLSAAKARSHAARKAVEAQWAKPDLAALRQEEMDAWSALMDAERHEIYDRVFPTIIGKQIAGFRSTIANVDIPHVSAYDGAISFTDVVVVLSDGSTFTLEYNQLKYRQA